MFSTDKILAACAEMGFLVWRMDQGATELGMLWHVTLEDTTADPLAHYRGEAATCADALAAALAKAGVTGFDVPSDEATYLLDLADRLFHHGTPEHGTDGGDVDRLREIAGTA